jgi:hypothetical protein
MKKWILAVMLVAVTLMTMIPKTSNAFVWIIVKEVVKKVIVAIDLEVERLQNKTIALQNAEKVIENKLSKLKLNEISQWAEKQRQLFSEYYTELQKVKSVIATYERVKQVIKEQSEMADEYKRDYNLFRQDKNFSPQELKYMSDVYSGMINASVDNLNEILLALQSFSMQMDDAARLATIDRAAAKIESTISEMRQFTNRNLQLSLLRAQSTGDVMDVKKLYGLP